jgi:hypothetical protein
MIQCHNQSILDLVTKEFFDPLVFGRHVLHCTEMVSLPMLAVALDPSSTVSGGATKLIPHGVRPFIQTWP